MDSATFFDDVSMVLDSWAHLKRLENYQEKFGVCLFHKIFELAPGEWDVFPWGGCLDECSSEAELRGNTAFLRHAKHFVNMLDLSIDMLGPSDMEILEVELMELGARHVGFGVKDQHYPLMGTALTHALEKTLGEKFNPRKRNAWKNTYAFMCDMMIQGADGM